MWRSQQRPLFWHLAPSSGERRVELNTPSTSPQHFPSTFHSCLRHIYNYTCVESVHNVSLFILNTSQIRFCLLKINVTHGGMEQHFPYCTIKAQRFLYSI